MSSSYLESRCCELAQRGYNRDGNKGKLQIVCGPLRAESMTVLAMACVTAERIGR